MARVTIRVLLLTHNRPDYTALSFRRLTETLPDDARIAIWDNASGPETVGLLQTFESHALVERVVYHQQNARIRQPTNWFFDGVGEAELVGIVADDCLMPFGWVETLRRAHEDIPTAGILGAWPFPLEDFDLSLASKKIQTFNGHQIVRNCWVAGSGYLMKRSVIERVGTLKGKESTFPKYCIRAAAAGFVNGWYYPLLFQDHMDDPRSEHTAIRTEEDFQRLRPLSADTFNLESRQDWEEKLRKLARSLQTCSYEPKDYLGPKAWVRQRVGRVLRRPYSPRA
jgi:GT2 family glycosyltransferase